MNGQEKQMVKAIRIHVPGGPEVLRWEDVAPDKPGEGHVLLRQQAVGLNYIDVYHRTGLYPVPSLPFTPGLEAAGVVEVCGSGVEGFKPGDRVGYAKGAPGAYAEYRVMPQEQLIALPEAISFEHAAGALLKGLTAHYLLRRTFDAKPGMTLLVWAAAGGVGQFLCQWGKALGAQIIGVVGSEEKAAFALENGCDVVLLRHKEDIVARVRELTDGQGCNVVYDAVGRDSFMTSLDCLMPFGLMVSYGQASGPIAPFDPQLLMEKGSLFLTRPSLLDYKASPEEYQLGAQELFELVGQGKIKIHIGQSYYLRDAATAHRDLEAGKTKGSTILLPS